MSIEEICKKYHLRNYTINEDGTVDVDGDVNIVTNKGNKLLIRFGNVSGSFDCEDWDLTSLEGCPIEVGGDFNCTRNNLTTLEGAPKKVGGNFSCSDNRLTTLEGCPKKVGRNFDCNDNQLTDLKHCPTEVVETFSCMDNDLTTLEYCPIKVGMSFYVLGNKITNIDGFTTKIGSYFYCGDNPIGSIFRDVEEDFLDMFRIYRVIKGNQIEFKRLKYVMQMFNEPIYLDMIKKHYEVIAYLRR